MAVTKPQILSLYRRLLKESNKFTSYNYRIYFLRRVKEEFRNNKSESNADSVEKLYGFGEENLQMIKRQVLIGRQYKSDPLVIEKKLVKNST